MQIEKSPPPVSEAEMCPDFTGKTFTKKNTFVINLPRKSCIVCVIIDKKKQETKNKNKDFINKKKKPDVFLNFFLQFEQTAFEIQLLCILQNLFFKRSSDGVYSIFYFLLDSPQKLSCCPSLIFKGRRLREKNNFNCARKSSAFKLFCSLPGPGSVFIGNRKSALHCYVTYI